MAKTKLVWRCSYSTSEFDTSDGDLDYKEYADHIDGLGERYFVRLESKKRTSVRIVDKDDFDTTGKTKVAVVGEAIYDEFLLPNGKTLRERGDMVEYDKRKTVPDHPQPKKELNDSEMLTWQ